MSPTELPITKQPIEQKSKVKRQKFIGAWRRSLVYAVVTAVFGVILTWASGGGLIAIATSFVVSAILGMAISIIQSLDERVIELEKINADSLAAINFLRKSYMEELLSMREEHSVNEKRVSNLMEEFDGLVRNAAIVLKFHSTMRSLLDGADLQKHLIEGFLDEAMNRPVFTQPLKEDIFYKLVVKGIQQCKESWQAIHQGSISDLPYAFSYLHQLKETGGPLKKRRIVILNEDEQKELDDYDKVDRFLRHTEGTESYWISHEMFYSEFDIPSKMRLDDAALYDGKLLLLRHRSTQLTMLALKGQRDRACDGIIEAFNRLNLDIERNQLGIRFKTIEQSKRP